MATLYKIKNFFIIKTFLLSLLQFIILLLYYYELHLLKLTTGFQKLTGLKEKIVFFYK